MPTNKEKRISVNEILVTRYNLRLLTSFAETAQQNTETIVKYRTKRRVKRPRKLPAPITFVSWPVVGHEIKFAVDSIPRVAKNANIKHAPYSNRRHEEYAASH